MRIPDNIAEIIDFFSAFSTYIYGGAVREMLSGNAPSRCKIAVAASPSELGRIFPKITFSRGALNVRMYGVDCRIAVLRDDMRDICSHADFTVNSLAYSPVTGILDYSGGVSDIENRLVRFNDAAELNLRENPHLMLRAVRFAAEQDYRVEQESERLIKRCALFVRYADKRSVMSELTKLLMSARPDDFRELHKLGLLRCVLPELDRCFGEKQKNKYHIYDVGEHTMAAVKNTPRDYVLRWAALFHDAGKPSCSSTDANGTIHFYGHHRESRAIADDSLHKLGMKQEYLRDILVLIENHDVRVEPNPVSVKRMMAKTGPELFDKLMLLQTADNMAKNPAQFPEKYRRINAARNIAAQIIKDGEPYSQEQLAVNSKDLLKAGFRRGRELNDALRALTEEVIRDPSLNKRDYLLGYAERMKREA